MPMPACPSCPHLLNREGVLQAAALISVNQARQRVTTTTAGSKATARKRKCAIGKIASVLLQAALLHAREAEQASAHPKRQASEAKEKVKSASKGQAASNRGVALHIAAPDTVCPAQPARAVRQQGEGKHRRQGKGGNKIKASARHRAKVNARTTINNKASSRVFREALPRRPPCVKI